jgi:excinuclease ABC subunit A
MVLDQDSNEVRFFREFDVSNYWNLLPESRTNLFSFQLTKRACDHSNVRNGKIKSKKIIPNPKLSIKAGGFAPLANTNHLGF